MKKHIEKISGWIALIIIISSWGYFIFSVKQDVSHNGKHCSRVIYFNTAKKSFDTIYDNSIAYDDSLISFTDENGSTWIKRDIAHEDDETYGENDYISQRDITLTNGHRYKVKLLDTCACGNAKNIDSLKEENK